MSDKLHKVGRISAKELAAINWQLYTAPELWNEYRERLDTAPTHAQVDDIWLRYRARSEYDAANPKPFFSEPHFPVWYPGIYKVPMVKEIAFDLMCKERATVLGGVLITRIPPGKSVLPHIDTGWHPTFYNRKLYVVLQSNENCLNRVEEEAACMKPGEVWFFDNTKEHEVVNLGETNRITLIVCLHTEG